MDVLLVNTENIWIVRLKSILIVSQVFLLDRRWIFLLAVVDWLCHCHLNGLSVTHGRTLCSHFVPAGNLTRGRSRKIKKVQSVTLVAPENMEILDYCDRENAKRCVAKKSGIWIGSFKCVRSGQILLRSSHAWRKFICKLHPNFGEIAPFFTFKSRCTIGTE